MTGNDLQTTQDQAWRALGAYPVRRALLGRERCDVLVAIAAEEIVSAAGRGLASGHRDASRAIARRVGHRYDERAGFALSTFLLSWAISAIVEALIARWWAKRHPAEPTP